MPLRTILCVVVMSLLAFGSGNRTVAADETYDIDVLLPLTGSFALLGRDINEAVGVLGEYVNRTGGIGARPVRFVVHDDQSNPQLAVQLVSAVIANHPAVMLGPVPTANCNAVIPLLRDGPVAYCISPGVHPPPNSFAFSSSFATRDLNVGCVRFLRERGWKRVALLILTDASGQDAEKGLNDAFAMPENREMTVVAREHFNANDVSVAAQLTRIKASGAQVLISWQNGSPTGTVLRGANDIGLNLPIVTSTGNATYAEMHEFNAFMPPGLYFPGVPAIAPAVVTNRAMRSAVDAFRSSLIAHHIRPEYVHTDVWDPALLLVDALRKLGPEATAATVYAYIQGLRGWTGINGLYDFRANPERGLGSGGTVMVRWDRERDDFVPESSMGGMPLRR